MSDLVILHNSVDKPSLQLLAGIAAADQPETNHSVWIDHPPTGARSVGTITGEAPIDEQIASVIASAKAILYVVGIYGEGRYQKEQELNLVKEAVESRQDTDNPVNLIPLLLHGGRVDDFPQWMRRYHIVNLDHSGRTIPAVWQLVKQRLSTPEKPQSDREASKELSPESDLIDRLIAAMHLPRKLTIFLGPYSSKNDNGPAAATRHFAEEAGIPEEQTAFVWPSEAAQWAEVGKDRDQITEAWIRHQTGVGTNPDTLARSIGDLAEAWRKAAIRQERAGVAPEHADSQWSGLVILTTNTDLALENVFTTDKRFLFTRIVPTLQNVSNTNLRRSSIQRWDVDDLWEALPNAHSDKHVDIGSDKPDQFQDFSMDGVSQVVLVKLCGTVDIRESLVLSAEDIYRHSETYRTLPPQLELSIRSSARLILGQGFSSPLAQMIRYRVLSYTDPDRIRLWVVPPANDHADKHKPRKAEPEENEEQKGDEDPNDELRQLEMTKLERHENKLLRVLGLTDIHRACETKFLSSLTGKL